MRSIGLLGFVAAVVAGTLGCHTERQSEPLTAQRALDAEELRGQRVFMRECNGCHPQGAGGLGPALNNKPVPAVAIKIQVRQGFGAMPSFSENEINPQELDALVAFMS